MIKPRKVGIIGSGHVGASVASAIALRGIADEIVLIDIIENKAMGQALDLDDAASYYSKNVKVYYGGYDLIKDADILINAASGPIQKDDRLKEIRTSIEVVKDIAPKIVNSGFKGIIVSISNPCDIIAYKLAKLTNLNVIGSGTALDSSRVKVCLGRLLNLDPHCINAYSYGEHGNSQFIPYSVASINGKSFNDYLKEENIIFDEDEFLDSIKKRAWKIFEAKPCTEFGIGNAVAEIVDAIFNDRKIVLPVSYMLNGEYGLHDVYLSLPRVLGKNGVEKTIIYSLNEKEIHLLNNSAKVIKDNINKF